MCVCTLYSMCVSVSFFFPSSSTFILLHPLANSERGYITRYGWVYDQQSRLSSSDAIHMWSRRICRHIRKGNQSSNTFARSLESLKWHDDDDSCEWFDSNSMTHCFMFFIFFNFCFIFIFYFSLSLYRYFSGRFNRVSIYRPIYWVSIAIRACLV